MLAACVLPANAQSLCSNVDYRTVKACSLTGVNGDCTIIVDRMRAATPPTIYVRRGKIVTLNVINPSPLEKLELNETSINTQVPVDSVQALAPLLTQLGQFVLPLQQPMQRVQAQESVQLTSNPIAIPNPPPGSKSFEDIQDEQTKLSNKILEDIKVNPDALTKLAKALAILRALLAPPVDGCNSGSDWRLAQAKFSTVVPDLTAVHDTIKDLVGDPEKSAGGAGASIAEDVTALAIIQAHIDRFAIGMAASQKKVEDEIAGLKTSNADLQKRIDEEGRKPRPDNGKIKQWTDIIKSQKQEIEKKQTDADRNAADWQVQFDQLKSSQSVLGDMLNKAQTIVKTVLFPAETKLQNLVNALGSPTVFSGPFTITDLLKNDKNDQQEVFTLNAVNYLTDPVKIFIASAATDPYSQKLADSIVTTAPTKTAVMQATVQYVTQPEMEVTAGILVPFLPYKAYTAAPQSAGSATLVVQETHTFTIIPAVDLNFRLGNDMFLKNKRYGWFGTVAVGYNPATSMAEFGVGLSLAVKSMMFSFVADIGRDTALASGFTKNQPLPGAATTPATNGVWSVKPSIGFSIRLPFNSGSK